MKESLRIALLLAVVALIYGNTLRNEFTMDDGIYVLRNPQVTNASVPGLFAPNKVSAVFRPLSFATFALNWRFGGAHPFARLAGRPGATSGLLGGLDPGGLLVSSPEGLVALSDGIETKLADLTPDWRLASAEGPFVAALSPSRLPSSSY